MGTNAEEAAAALEAAEAAAAEAATKEAAAQTAAEEAAAKTAAADPGSPEAEEAAAEQVVAETAAKEAAAEAVAAKEAAAKAAVVVAEAAAEEAAAAQVVAETAATEAATKAAAAQTAAEEAAAKTAAAEAGSPEAEEAAAEQEVAETAAKEAAAEADAAKEAAEKATVEATEAKEAAENSAAAAAAAATGEQPVTVATPATETGGAPPPDPNNAGASAEKSPEEEKKQKEYDMFLSMCKSLTLQLPFERDRVIASKWVKKINTSEEEIVERIHFLKLLCVSLISHKLAGPFKNIPKTTPELDELANISSNDIINDMVQETTVFKTAPYYVEMSGDLKEYVAYQEIPNFGAHFYYAFSNETILNWHNESRAIAPSGGINYPIFNPPLKHISKSANAFKEAYSKYATPEPADVIQPNALPNLVPELHKRHVITKDEISRMGTKKLISMKCKCPADPSAVQNKKPSTVACGSKPVSGPSANGRPAGCGAKVAAQGRVPACVAARQARTK